MIPITINDLQSKSYKRATDLFCSQYQCGSFVFVILVETVNTSYPGSKYDFFKLLTLLSKTFPTSAPSWSFELTVIIFSAYNRFIEEQAAFVDKVSSLTKPLKINYSLSSILFRSFNTNYSEYAHYYYLCNTTTIFIKHYTAPSFSQLYQKYAWNLLAYRQINLLAPPITNRNL